MTASLMVCAPSGNSISDLIFLFLSVQCCSLLLTAISGVDSKRFQVAQSFDAPTTPLPHFRTNVATQIQKLFLDCSLAAVTSSNINGQSDGRKEKSYSLRSCISPYQSKSQSRSAPSDLQTIAVALYSRMYRPFDDVISVRTF